MGNRARRASGDQSTEAYAEAVAVGEMQADASWQHWMSWVLARSSLAGKDAQSSAMWESMRVLTGWSRR